MSNNEQLSAPDPRQKIVTAVRALLDAFEGEQPEDGSAIDAASLNKFSQMLEELRSTPAVLHSALAMLGSLTRWACHETGRTEDEILAELTSTA